VIERQRKTASCQACTSSGVTGVGPVPSLPWGVGHVSRWQLANTVTARAGCTGWPGRAQQQWAQGKACVINEQREDGETCCNPLAQARRAKQDGNLKVRDTRINGS
jgi:hypothetical protein